MALQGDGGAQRLETCCGSSSWSPLASNTPVALPLLPQWDWSWGAGDPAGSSWNLPHSRSRLSEHKTEPLLPVTQPHSHPLCQGEPGPGRLESQPPPPGSERKEEEMNHSRRCPHSHPQLTQKALPKVSAPHIRAHTHLLAPPTQTVPTDVFREPRHPWMLAETEAFCMTSSHVHN